MLSPTDRATLVGYIKAAEGDVLHMYKDQKGILTIGYGHNLEARPISEAAATHILGDDVADTETELLHKVPVAATLDEVRYAALVEMAFTMGVGNVLDFHHMLDALTAKDYAKAADYMLDSEWARSEAPARAHRIAGWMRTGAWT